MKAQIALGMGNNIDYEIVWDSAVFEEMIVRHAIRADDLSSNGAIRSERDLVVSILAFLAAGNGGERPVASSAIIEEFAGHFRNKITLGGTSVRAAIAMRKLGYLSALHLVTINEHVRRLIPQDSPWVCSNPVETLFPHLIVQFGHDVCVAAGDISIHSRRANRIIYHNDDDNVRMELHEGYAELIREAQVFLISGFNAMRSKALLIDRLATLRSIMAALPAGAQVFYEDAGFYDPAFSGVVNAALADTITIYSLNEDELQGHLGRELDLLDAGQVGAGLADLHRLIPVPLIVVHSMYWALAYGQGANRIARALKGGVTMATTRFCYGDEFTAEEYHTIESVAPNPLGRHFAQAIARLLGDQVCCVAVAQVEQANGTTIGLGDAFVGGFLPALLA